MQLVVGVDIGNSTTEGCAAEIVDDGSVRYLASSLTPTSGIKGTTENVSGVMEVVASTLLAAGRDVKDLYAVLINEATPVVSDLAMETITETIITESTMIGHNPNTPGGGGLGLGTTVAFTKLSTYDDEAPVICVISKGVDFDEAASGINDAVRRGVKVTGAVVCDDDATLIANRLAETIPVVDEVTLVDRVPLGMMAAVEVADMGRTIRTLSNSYGIASVFGLSPEETRMIAPVARALVGNRSAVVVRTPAGDVTDRRIPAGALTVIGTNIKRTVDVGAGADEIMEAVRRAAPLLDAVGEPGTNVGGMLSRVREMMSSLTDAPMSDVRIRDVLAVDTFVPQKVTGGLAGEFALENATALAAMVRTSMGLMGRLADELKDAVGVDIQIGGVEADMAVLGGLTTPGADRPVAVLDLGGGSTDAALARSDAEVRSVHLAGAGDLVTKLIDSELGLGNLELAEEIKRCPLAKAESFFLTRLEDGTVRFYDDPLPASLFARVVVLTDHGMVPIPSKHSMEKIRQVRREAKRSVFVVNALRALEQVAPDGAVRLIHFVVLLGGSALDFEISDMIAESLSDYGIVCGTGNVRGSEGPRNAVATGLVSKFAGVQSLANVEPGKGQHVATTDR